MVCIAYFTQLNLQICDYAQKRRICRENCKYVLDENFHCHFCSRRKAAKFCHPDGPLWFQIWKWSLECWPKQYVLCMKTVYRFLKENGPQIFQIWKCHPREEKVWITASYLCPLRNSLSLIIFIPVIVRWFSNLVYIDHHPNGGWMYISVLTKNISQQS